MAINVTLGTPDYRYNGEIAVPVTFAEAVISPSKTIFPISHVSGSPLTDIDYTLVGQNTAFHLIFEVPPDRKGSFRIAGSGSVLKGSAQSGSSSHDNVMVTPVTVPYDTTVPKIVDFEVPSQYVPGKPFHVLVAWNTRATGWHQNNTLTGDAQNPNEPPSVWINEGAELGTPTPYKWTDTDTPPDIHGEAPFISVVTHNVIAMSVAVDAVLPLNIDAFNGAGPIEITNSAAGAGAYAVRGVDENGAMQTETLTFGASDTTMTTTNNFRSAGLEIEVVTAFATDTTADIEVDTIAFTEDHWALLDAPPGGTPTPDTNGFDRDGNWHGAEGQYFLIFWNAVDAGAVGNVILTLRPDGPMRGPVR